MEAIVDFVDYEEALPHDWSETLLEKIEQRLSKLKEALTRESWLPLGLRSILAEELAFWKKQIKANEIRLKELAQRVNAVAFIAYSYGDVVTKSEAVKGFFVFDLELESSRRKSTYHSSPRDQFRNRFDEAS